MSEEVETPVGQGEFFHYKNITFQRVPNGSEMSGAWNFTKEGKQICIKFPITGSWNTNVHIYPVLF